MRLQPDQFQSNDQFSIGSDPDTILFAIPRSDDRSSEEKRVDDAAKRRKALGAVDRRPQVRPVFQSLGVPGSQRSNLVDHPAIVAGGMSAGPIAGFRRASRRRLP